MLVQLYKAMKLARAHQQQQWPEKLEIAVNEYKGHSSMDTRTDPWKDASLGTIRCGTNMPTCITSILFQTMCLASQHKVTMLALTAVH